MPRLVGAHIDWLHEPPASLSPHCPPACAPMLIPARPAHGSVPHRALTQNDRSMSPNPGVYLCPPLKTARRTCRPRDMIARQPPNMPADPNIHARSTPASSLTTHEFAQSSSAALLPSARASDFSMPRPSVPKEGARARQGRRKPFQPFEAIVVPVSLLSEEQVCHMRMQNWPPLPALSHPHNPLHARERGGGATTHAIILPTLVRPLAYRSEARSWPHQPSFAASTAGIERPQAR